MIKLATLFKVFLMATLLALPNITNAQVKVEAVIDTNMLLIGDQTQLRLKASFPAGYQIKFPLFADTVIDKLEVVEVLKPDTSFTDQVFTISANYVVTSFDSGWYVVPPLQFLASNGKSIDTLYSKAIYFGVINMVLDTTNRDAIADIKNVLDAPLTFKEVLPFAGIGFLALVVIFLAYVLYMKLSMRKPVFKAKEKPVEPPHLIAYRDLEALKEAKLWQKGETKEYFSKLTEILRAYIENRYHIPALEQTTDEIVETLRENKLVERSLNDKLLGMLTLADFVKFAKANTVGSENEASMALVYEFVDKTKPVEAEPKDETQNNDVVATN